MILFLRPLLFVVFLMTFNSAQACWGDPTLSCALTRDITTIEISSVAAKNVLPSDRKLSDFLGVHALFWGVQHDLYASSPSKVSPEAISLLSSTGVGSIRYGGGVNEIDWRGCQGFVLERPKQKVAPWIDAVRCIFGIQEYEVLNDELNLGSTWHIANVVGFEGGVIDTAFLAKEAGDYALKVKELSSGRKRFWELGNELDRSWPSWSAEKIVERSLPVANEIKRVDPGARLVLPLIEFKSALVKDDDGHNKFLIRHFKGLVSDYALHLYYENDPWGPSVANRLAYTRKVIGFMYQAGVKSPSVWITEHARPPAGTPADAFWKKNWYQTNNHDAVVATADFLIGATQIPEVQGAFWHGLRAGPWNYLEIDNGKLRPSRIAKLFELLKPSESMQALPTQTLNKTSVYAPTRYIVRASAFRDKDRNLWLWVVNRDEGAQRIQFKGNAIPQSDLKVEQTFLTSGEVNGLVSTQHYEFKNSDAMKAVILPGRSIAVLKIQEEHKQ